MSTVFLNNLGSYLAVPAGLFFVVGLSILAKWPSSKRKQKKQRLEQPPSDWRDTIQGPPPWRK